MRTVQTAFHVFVSGESIDVRRTFGELIGDGFDAALAVVGLGDEWMTAGGLIFLQPACPTRHAGGNGRNRRHIQVSPLETDKSLS